MQTINYLKPIIMEKNMGIWIDTKQAVIITLTNTKPLVKKISSTIETREREAGETKKYGRFGGQYLTYEKKRLHKRTEQTHTFFKELLKEIKTCDTLVVFGPSTMKKLFEKEINSHPQFSQKLKGSFNAELLTENQMVAWVKDFYKK